MTTHIVPNPIRIEGSPLPEPGRPRPQTPLCAPFALLSPGTFPQNDRITDTALKALCYPCFIDPYYKAYGSLDYGFLENPQSGSHPRLCGDNRRQMQLILKARQLESGAPPCIAAIGSPNPDEIYHFPPGTGPFIEVLVAKYMQHCVQHVSIKGQPIPLIPEIGYGQIGHIGMCLLQRNKTTIPTRGTFSFQRLISQCQTLWEKMIFFRSHYLPSCPEATIIREFYFGMDGITLEVLAALDIITLAGDRHMKNVLVCNGSKPLIVLIDHARSLSVEGKRTKFFWIHCPQLQKPPSQVIKNFIQSLNDTDLEKIADGLKTEIQSNLRRLPQERQAHEEEYINLPLERLLPHKIAIAYLQRMIELDVPLACIGFAIQGFLHPYIPAGGAIYRIYKELQQHPVEEWVSLIPEAVEQELRFCRPSCEPLPTRCERDPLSFDSKKETPPPAVTEELLS